MQNYLITEAGNFLRKNLQKHFFNTALIRSIELNDLLYLKKYFNENIDKFIANKSGIIKDETQIMSYIDSCNLEIPVFSIEDLKIRAIDNRNTPEDDHNRIYVNYLRHGCTKYDFVLKTYPKNFDEKIFYSLLKKTILNKIMEKYAFLIDECLNQMKEFS